MPMHCSANVGTAGRCRGVLRAVRHRQDDAVGRSQAHPARRRRARLVADDGIFNFEGGCYAKTIRLSKEAEPEIWAATNRFGTVLENVILESRLTRVPDFDDGRLTENTRSAYPLEFISNASRTGTAGHPKNIVMLTADAFGVLPPIAKLSPSQAMYHFLSGYTAKVAGTEKGVGSEPQATFSTCFGAPFMPRHPSVYGNLLRELIAKHNVDCWLVNTGWTGGKFGVGRRMPIKATRALLDAALSGAPRSRQPMRTDPLFGFQVPTVAAGRRVRPSSIRATPGATRAPTTRRLDALVEMFNIELEKFVNPRDADVMAAAPALRHAAGVSHALQSPVDGGGQPADRQHAPRSPPPAIRLVPSGFTQLDAGLGDTIVGPEAGVERVAVHTKAADRGSRRLVTGRWNELGVQCRSGRPPRRRPAGRFQADPGGRLRTTAGSSGAEHGARDVAACDPRSGRAIAGAAAPARWRSTAGSSCLAAARSPPCGSTTCALPDRPIAGRPGRRRPSGTPPHSWTAPAAAPSRARRSPPAGRQRDRRGRGCQVAPAPHALPQLDDLLRTRCAGARIGEPRLDPGEQPRRGSSGGERLSARGDRRRSHAPIAASRSSLALTSSGHGRALGRIERAQHVLGRQSVHVPPVWSCA